MLLHPPLLSVLPLRVQTSDHKLTTELNLRNKLVCVGNGERLDSNQQAPCTETEACTDGTSDPRVQEGRFSSLFWPGVQQRQGLLAFACSQSRSLPLRAALEAFGCAALVVRVRLVPKAKIFGCLIVCLTRCREDFSDTN